MAMKKTERFMAVLLKGGDIAPRWAVKEYQGMESSFRVVGGER
jgi:hypothetical protein